MLEGTLEKREKTMQRETESLYLAFDMSVQKFGLLFGDKLVWSETAFEGGLENQSRHSVGRIETAAALFSRRGLPIP